MHSGTVPIIDPRVHDAVIFDMDGVITDTATLHANAWKRMFDEFLQGLSERTGVSHEPFDTGYDYLRYVDGRAREDGTAGFLASRGIELQEGKPTDPPEAESVWGLSTRKQLHFQGMLQSEGAESYPGSVALLSLLRDMGIPTAVITASRNASDVLESAGVSHFFATKVDGNDAELLGLSGKPAPDVFIEAAKRLGTMPSRTVVVEDAQAGVQAGRAGGFALVVGVDRAGQAQELLEHGADSVVGDVGEVRVLTRSGRSIPGLAKPVKIRELPSALDVAEGAGDAFGGVEPVFYLDYDGTLTPIVERPEDALLPRETRDMLRTLVDLTTVAVISGRDVAFVREQVDVEGVVYAGSHGFDIVGPVALDGSRLREFEEYIPLVEQAEVELRNALADVPGANVERKKFSVAAHYRRVPPEHAHLVEEAVEEVVRSQPRLRVGHGKMVFEVRPDIEWDKGRAVLWLHEALGLASTDKLPIYIGDDITDEDAFSALRAIGLGIVVGEGDRPTLASYALRDPDQVRTFLEDMTRLLREGRRNE